MIDDILAKFDGAFAKNTIRAYRSDFIQYQTWCSHNNIDSIPATAEVMAQYVDYLATIRKSATIRRRINSLGPSRGGVETYSARLPARLCLMCRTVPYRLGPDLALPDPVTII